MNITFLFPPLIVIFIISAPLKNSCYRLRHLRFTLLMGLSVLKSLLSVLFCEHRWIKRAQIILFSQHNTTRARFLSKPDGQLSQYSRRCLFYLLDLNVQYKVLRMVNASRFMANGEIHHTSHLFCLCFAVYYKKWLSKTRACFIESSGISILFENLFSVGLLYLST